MFEDLDTCLLRDDEEKLVFTYDEPQDEPTIVAEDKDFFTQTQTQNHIPIVEEEQVEEKKGNKKKIAIISGCVVGALLIFGLVYFFFLRPASTFEMPNVINMTEQQAIDMLESYDLKVDTKQTKHELSDTVDEGNVTATDPVERSAVKKGDTVILTVSSGKYIVIDNYVGRTFDDVEAELKKLNITVKKEEVTSEEDKGKILEQSLPQGEKIDPNATQKTITLTVSKGYSVTVPNVYGQDINKAKDILEKEGFKVVLKPIDPPTTVEEIKTMKINVVVRQSLDAFTVIYKKGETITLEYYNHKPEVPTEPTEPTTPGNGTDTNQGGGGTTPSTN